MRIHLSELKYVFFIVIFKNFFFSLKVKVIKMPVGTFQKRKNKQLYGFYSENFNILLISYSHLFLFSFHFFISVYVMYCMY
jgi:hypothetical protein